MVIKKAYRCRNCGATYSEDVAQKFLEMMFQTVEIEEPEDRPQPMPMAKPAKTMLKPAYELADKEEEESEEEDLTPE